MFTMRYRQNLQVDQFLALGQVFLPALRLFPCSDYPHPSSLKYSFIRRTSGRCFGNFKRNAAVLDMAEHRKEISADSYFHMTLFQRREGLILKRA